MLNSCDTFIFVHVVGLSLLCVVKFATMQVAAQLHLCTKRDYYADRRIIFAEVIEFMDKHYTADQSRLEVPPKVMFVRHGNHDLHRRVNIAGRDHIERRLLRKYAPHLLSSGDLENMQKEDEAEARDWEAAAAPFGDSPNSADTAGGEDSGGEGAPTSAALRQLFSRGDAAVDKRDMFHRLTLGDSEALAQLRAPVGSVGSVAVQAVREFATGDNPAAVQLAADMGFNVDLEEDEAAFSKTPDSQTAASDPARDSADGRPADSAALQERGHGLGWDDTSIDSAKHMQRLRDQRSAERYIRESILVDVKRFRSSVDDVAAAERPEDIDECLLSVALHALRVREGICSSFITTFSGSGEHRGGAHPPPRRGTHRTTNRLLPRPPGDARGPLDDAWLARERRRRAGYRARRPSARERVFADNQRTAPLLDTVTQQLQVERQALKAAEDDAAQLRQQVAQLQAQLAAAPTPQKRARQTAASALEPEGYTLEAAQDDAQTAKVQSLLQFRRENAFRPGPASIVPPAHISQVQALREPTQTRARVQRCASQAPVWARGAQVRASGTSPCRMRPRVCVAALHTLGRCVRSRHGASASALHPMQRSCRNSLPFL